jgi:hypothetical protein
MRSSAVPTRVIVHREDPSPFSVKSSVWYFASDGRSDMVCVVRDVG